MHQREIIIELQVCSTGLVSLYLFNGEIMQIKQIQRVDLKVRLVENVCRKTLNTSKKTIISSSFFS